MTSRLNHCAAEDIAIVAHGGNISKKNVIHINLPDLAKGLDNLTLKTKEDQVAMLPNYTYERQVAV